MEAWQRAHISNNLVRLINLTSCNVKLLAYLKSGDVLSAEDFQKLQLPSITSPEKAAILYDILKSRQDAYDKLIQALQSTQQTGAVDILQNHVVRYQNFRKILYDKNNVLGSGTFSTVYGGKFGERDVAIKVQSTKYGNVKVADKEIQFLRRLDPHPNIVQYFAVEEDDEVVFTVLERCAISLQDEVKLNLIKMKDMDILSQCTKGLDFLHENQIIHRDLKPANILLTDYKEVKISDFGFNKTVPADSSDALASCVVAATQWMAPEVLAFFDDENENNYPPTMNVQTDVFALGCIFYFALSKGIHPFGSGFIIPLNICQDRPNLQTSHVNGKWFSIIGQMISHEPEDRPTTSEILRTAMFRPVNPDICQKCFRCTSPMDPVLSPFISFSEGDHSSGYGSFGQPSSHSGISSAYHNPPSSRYTRTDSTASSIDVEIFRFEDLQSVSKDNGWQKFILKWRRNKLVEVVNFSDEFLERLHYNGVLSEFYLHQTKIFIKEQKKEEFFNIPFTKVNYFEGIMEAFRETSQANALTVIEEAYQTNQKWQSYGANIISTPFKILAEAIGHHCKVSWLRRVYEMHSDKSVLFQSDKEGRNLLHFAAGCGHVEAMKYLISIGLDVKSKTISNRTPLHYLGRYGGNIVAVCKILLQHGADLFARDLYNNTVAHIVCLYVTPEEYLEWMKFMLAYGHTSLWKEKSRDGYTPIHTALRYREVIPPTLTLLDAAFKFDFNTATDHGETPLMLAAVGGQHQSILEYMVELGGDCRRRNNWNSNVLHFAIKGSNLEAVEYFLALGVDPYARDVHGWTPLHRLKSACLNHIEITELLLEKVSIFATSKAKDNVAHLFGRRTELSTEYQEWKKYVKEIGYDGLFHKKNLKGEFPK